MASIAPAAEPVAKPADETGTRIYDTGELPELPYSPEQTGLRSGWQLLAEGSRNHTFKGFVALANETLVVVLDPRGASASVSSRSNDGMMYRCTVGARRQKDVIAYEGFKADIVENTPGAIAVRLTSKGDSERTMAVVYRLTTGLPVLEVRPGVGTAALSVRSECSWLVIPEFFGDDLVFDPSRELGPRLPAENAVVCLADRGDAAVVCLWKSGANDPQGVSMERPVKRSAGWRIACAKNQPVWLGFLEGRGLWHEQPIKAQDADKDLPLSRPRSLSARWRADFVRKDSTCLSVTSEDEAVVLKAPVGFEGTRIVYPLDRSRSTPLDVFTPMDIMRNTLGVGPCQYVLDSEGLAGGEAATPAFVMEWVEKQLKKKKIDTDEVRERLKSMTAHVGRTHARIQKYADLTEEVQGLLARGWSGVPPSNEVVAATEKLRATAADMKASAATGMAATEAEKVAKPADELAALVGKEDAAAKAAGPVAEVRAVGAAEDRALAKCRMATRWLRCQCLDIAEGDVVKKAPALAEVAKKIEARAAEMLQAK